VGTFPEAITLYFEKDYDMKKIAISVILLSLLAACASEKPKASVVESKPAASADASKGAASASDSTAGAMAVDPLNDPNGILAKRSVYYPFDVYVVQKADEAIVQAHAKYLGEHANRKVRLEGNCDERGSEEYNLALGQRRADGVKKLLLVGGAKESQIETVSYGEEKPKATGHDEASWSQNRRTDLNYSAN
jgi:peptidoglycan-associated lipoprotein